MKLFDQLPYCGCISFAEPAAASEALKVAHAVPQERPRPARRSETKGAATAERNQQSPSRLSAEHSEQVNSQPPDQAAQDALFLEFLRWKELQKSAKAPSGSCISVRTQ
jgi:hypothetical protein